MPTKKSRPRRRRPFRRRWFLCIVVISSFVLFSLIGMYADLQNKDPTILNWIANIIDHITKLAPKISWIARTYNRLGRTYMECYKSW
jgi:hypothetical protein